MRFVQGICQQVKSNRNWHFLIFRKDMAWHLRQLKLLTLIISQAPVGLSTPCLLSYMCGKTDTIPAGEKQPWKAKVNYTKMVSIYHAITFIRYSYIIVTNGKSLQNCYMCKNRTSTVINQCRQNRLVLLLSHSDPHRTNGGKLHYILTIRFASYIRSIL